MSTTKKQSDSANKQSPPLKIGQVVIVSFIAIIFTALWLAVYNWLNKIIWSNSYVTSHHFMIPIGVLLFALFIGLSQKFLHAPNMINGGMKDTFKGDSKVDNSNFPGALVSSYLSLLSGASIGPEGSLGLLVNDIAEWFRKKFNISDTQSQTFRMSALASAYNGIIGSPLFTGMLATELSDTKNGFGFIGWNLLAGFIGFAFFSILQLHTFAHYIPFTPIHNLTIEYILYAILLGVGGAVLAIFTGICFQFFGKVMNRFGDKVILRALAGGIITAIVVYFFPQVMFAGETQIFPMISNPASYGVLLLLLLAVLKLLLVALAFKSGYIGGPSFPLLFACTMIGLALSLIFPGIPVSIFVLCIEVSAVALFLGAPFTAILLVAVVGTADPNMIALLVLSAVVGISSGNILKDARAKKLEHGKTNV